MPLVFTRDEIQEYLSEMGYGELSEEDMEKFVKDLRKLVKTETKKRRRRRLGHSGLTSDLSSTVDDSNSPRYSENIEHPNAPPPAADTAAEGARPRLISTPKSKQKKFVPRRVEDSSEFSTQETTSDSNNYKSTPTTATDTSKGASRTSATSVTSDQSSTSHVSAPQSSGRVTLQEINGMRKSEIDGARRKRTEGEKEGQITGKGISSGRTLSQTVPPPVEVASSEGDVPSGDGSSSTGTLSDTDLLHLMEHILKTGLGVASYATSDTETNAKKKLEIPMKIRRDPVALYHWYKTFWDKQKPPGEDRHMQLRWNVRAGTIGRFPCDADGVPIHYLPIIPKQRKKIRAF